MTLYQRLISEPAAAALAQIYADQDATGTAPEPDLDVLAGLVVASRATRILQFGTFLGGSSVVLADLARQNGDPYRFVTVDPNTDYNALARKYTEQAGLTIETIDGYSQDPRLLAVLRKSVWDVIFLDTTHQYAQTVIEIEGIAKLCGPQTLFTFHDASVYAAETLDVNHQGGARRAMREFVLTHPAWQMYVFEKPSFGDYGIGVLSRKAGP